jgi:hypothetical protein
MNQRIKNGRACRYWAFVLSVIFLVSCDKDEPKTYKVDELNGFVQKGPYHIGANVTVSELNGDLSPTGRNFYSTITTQAGQFAIPSVEFSSPFVQIIADGTYFDEVQSSGTSSRLTLTALSDLSESSSINVNILTHLESDRVAYLLQNEELTFAQAKTQAQSEILEAFSITPPTELSQSESLNITQTGDLDGALLAISAIFQVQRSVSELTALLLQFKMDLREDGEISEPLMNELRVGSRILSAIDIEGHLKDYLGVETVPDFREHLNTFCNCLEDQVIIPQSTAFGINLLALPNNSILSKDSLYCIAVRVGSDVEFSDAWAHIYDKFSPLTWNHGASDVVNSTTHPNYNGWFYEVYFGGAGFYATLIRKGDFAIIPFDFDGSGSFSCSLLIYNEDLHVGRDLRFHVQ